MHAAQTRMAAAAHNVANANTPGYRRQAVEQQESADAKDASAKVQRQEQADRTQEAHRAEQKAALYDFQANVQALRAQDQATGALLNAKA